MGKLRELMDINCSFISTRRAFLLACFSSLIGSLVFSGCKDKEGDDTKGEQLYLPLGRPEDFPLGLKVMSQLRIGLFKSERQNNSYFKAIRLVCTHQACALRGPTENLQHLPESGVPLFACPCHGARFDLNGAVLQGPATRPLVWLKLSLSKEGEISLHPDEEVVGDWELAVENALPI